MSTPKEPGEREKLRTYLRYSGMALEFFVLIGVGAWIGQKLDAHFETSKPFITIICILFLAAGYFYKMYRDLTR